MMMIGRKSAIELASVGLVPAHPNKVMIPASLVGLIVCPRKHVSAKIMAHSNLEVNMTV